MDEKKYLIVRRTSLQELEDDVNALLSLGYLLTWDIHIDATNTYYYQVVVTQDVLPKNVCVSWETPFVIWWGLSINGWSLNVTVE